MSTSSQNLRLTLIQHFLQNQKTIQLNDTITLLAMIGIETVIQECSASNKSQIIQEIESIKDQLRFINENVQLKISSPSASQFEKSVSCQQLDRKESIAHLYEDNSKQKARPLTPKITEATAPSYREGQPPRFFTRHHLDDKLMKEALSQSYLDPAVEMQRPEAVKPAEIKPSNNNTKSPHTIKKKENVFSKPQKMKTPKPTQSIQYFLGQDDLKKWHPNTQNTQKPERSQKRDIEVRSKRATTEQDQIEDLIQERYELLKQEALMKYMEQINISKQNKQVNGDTFSMQPKNVFEQFDQVPIENITSFNQDMIPQQFFTQQNEMNVPNIKIAQTSHSPNFHSQQIKTHQTQQSQTSNRSNCGQNNILNIANSILNSPIIRQISIKQTNSSSLSENEQQKQKQVKFEQRETEGRHSVQVSGFDATSPHQSEGFESNFFKQINVDCEQEQDDNNFDTNQTSNSSAFSLFKPNEELRSFFQKEFQQNQFQNTDQSGETFQNTLVNNVQIQNSDVFRGKRILAQSNRQLENQNPNEGNSMFLSNGNINNKASNIFLKGRLGGASKIF